VCPPPTPTLRRIQGRIRGYKWSLLKVREGKYKKEHGGCRWNLQAERACFSSLGAFKTYPKKKKKTPKNPYLNQW
jgi:hypothetical protein